MPADPNSLIDLDRDALLHPATNLASHAVRPPLIIKEGKGIIVTDTNGRSYIEGMAGLWCTALGYGVEELAETAKEQLSTLAYGHMFAGRAHEPGIELAAKLKSIAPMPVSKVFFGNSGSDANDSQIKLIWYYNNAIGRPEKKKIIARKKGYHGVTIASASMTGLPVNHADFDLPIDRFVHTETPHHYRVAEPGESEEDFATRLADALEALIVSEGPDTVAAFIAEPLMGAGGVIVPPATYFEKIQAVLKRHDILLIDDEVICGFYRTGPLFGAEAFDMAPDTMTLAKALSSAYLPISAIMIPDFMYEPMIETSDRNGAFGHGYTYTGHPVCAAVAMKNLELMETWDISGHVARVHPRFQQRLQALSDHPLVGEARGHGLIGALELVADKASKTAFTPVGRVGLYCADACLEDGLIVRNLGDTIALCPPLIIQEDEIDAVFDRLTRALDATDEWVRREAIS